MSPKVVGSNSFVEYSHFARPPTKSQGERKQCRAGVLHNGARKQAMILFGKEEKERSGVGSADR